MRLASLPDWANYEFTSGLILGFHGCDASLGEAILRGEEPHLHPSANVYDWLGTGIYFWEGNVRRALQFATERMVGGSNSRGTIETPFVLGAVLNLRRNLNLSDAGALEQVKDAFSSLQEGARDAGQELPSNGRSLRTRNLDCFVFNSLHRSREQGGLPAYDSVRGWFLEGEELYPGAGMRAGDHVQICVRNTDCILGYFRPIENDLPEVEA